MNYTTPSRGSSWKEIALGQLLALLFLGACIAWIYHDLQFIIGSSEITVADAWAQARHSNLPLRAAAFALAVLAVHSLLGLAGWGLARLTRSAFRLPPRPGVTTVLILGWVAMLALLALAANATRFPASKFSNLAWRNVNWLGFQPVSWLVAGTTILVLALTVLALWHERERGSRLFVRPLLGLAIVAGLFVLPALQGAKRAVTPPTDKPHVIILGVDSLRNDLSEVAGGRPITPHIDEFLQQSYRFNDAMSPLARTFPAWVSILTGRHPVTTNARFNLMPRALVHEGETLPEALRAHGYRSVYATDEVRFANFDQSFGFDQLITPPMGASDFLLGTIGDVPLVNLVAGSALGRFLFPSNHANRAAHVTYRPEQFINRLDRELSFEVPSLAAIHLTLAHWPYSWADKVMPTTPQEWRPAYRDSIAAVDRQFQDVLDLLARKGALDNAIVVVLSDHGDALGYPSDSMLRKTGSSREIWDSLWGHGTSVMSPHQYGVLLAIRAFGSARVPGHPASLDWPVSLEDVRPTLEELVTGQSPANVDGVSLVPYLADGKSGRSLDGRIRFTETCFNTVKLMQGDFDASGVAREAAMFFEIDPRSGWVQLRRDRLPGILAKKQHAAVSADALFATIPSWTDETVTYLYTSRRSPLPRALSLPIDPVREPEAARLWEALQRRFPGELGDRR